MKSFIKVEQDSHFPIQNLPYGVFNTEANPIKRVGVAIGEYVLDLALLEREGYFSSIISIDKSVFEQPSLNPFMELGKQTWQQIRHELQSLLSEDNSVIQDQEIFRKQVFIKRDSVQLHVPIQIGDYTDFYASKEHATNVGTMFRGKEQALMPNWTHLPVGYHGRASSVILSGEKVRRPLGQIKFPDSEDPIFSKSKQLDFELEMGCVMGTGNQRGEPIPIEQAEDYIFGMVLVNDWSARDIQAWEYQPLGPFLAKNFATSISPWVIPLEALEPFRVSGPKQSPKPLDYLVNSKAGFFDIHLEVYLKSATMRKPEVICQGNYKNLYWSAAQQIAHHTSGGCDLNPGDLLASGTISGPEKQQRGSLLELTWRGSDPILLDNHEKRSWLEDGDEVTMTGWCQGEGYRVGFGEVSGTILPAFEPK